MYSVAMLVFSPRGVTAAARAASGERLSGARSLAYTPLHLPSSIAARRLDMADVAGYVRGLRAGRFGEDVSGKR